MTFLLRRLPVDHGARARRLPERVNPWVPDAGRVGDADSARSSGLRRTKAIATGLLGGCLVLFAASRLASRRYPAFEFVAAFAEAAAIGGIADWYAVVALFRRPLGLPIPHTALILSNRDRIAEQLGSFIEGHFLGASQLEERLRDIDFSSFIGRWLGDPVASADLADAVLRALSRALSTAETTGIRQGVAQRLIQELASIDIAPLTARTLRALVLEQRHRAILDEFLSLVHGLLEAPAAQHAMREILHRELPKLLRINQAEIFLIKRLASAATTFLDDVRADERHPLRAEYDRLIIRLVDKLENDPACAARVNGVKRDLLARPELHELGKQIGRRFRALVDGSSPGAEDLVPGLVSGLCAEAGRALAVDGDLRDSINQWTAGVLTALVDSNRSKVSRFISDQVKAWDMQRLTSVIETHVGRDLQFIRFNGMLVGGLAGLALYTTQWLIGWL
jgi:uncharacterized membrane-anchored protein YjiN (DUF445 family)